MLDGHNRSVNSISYSPNGKMIASISSDKTLKLWDIKTGKEIFSLNPNIGNLTKVTFNYNGSFIAVCGNEPFIKIWKTSDFVFK